MIRGRQTPLCARCLGILVGPILAPAWATLVPVVVSGIVVVLFVVDGVTQLLCLRQSNNWLRFATGTGFSASIVGFGWRLLRGA